ncbi:hypothetical protein [Geobacter argillaceus]|uniref:ParE-like toxin of type II ParDE toxin-antitoxin system n=1 Tax=Geobacter argillaceus TaxID=345631 RepID=A0A562VMU1_9BACT|nr:hypothetical protein [Geobacter argillaceus]TWJ19296.1 hypothetical protein JN12_01987 [Geobacter argillaceus]
MVKKFSSIRRTPTFMAAYAEMSSYLRRSSPLAFLALPSAMKLILDTIDRHPRSWPIKRTRSGSTEHEFHLAIVDIAYRRLHVRYHVDTHNIAHLLAIWVDGHDEPNYTLS